MKRLSQEWKRDESFDLSTVLNKSKKLIIEVGGPNESGFEFVEWEQFNDTTFVSNITTGSPTFNQQTGEFSHLYGKVDFQADATQLPFADSSLGTLRADSIPPNVFDNMIDEAYRVLTDNGILVLQGISSDDALFVSQNGFELMQYKMRDGEPYYCIFKKI